eukprot:754493-Alexandrium_andersonii.AAC.1
MEPQDRAINFGMFRGQTYSYVLLNRFGYFCWSIAQNSPGPLLQDFIDYGDVAIFDESFKVDFNCAYRYKVVTQNRQAPKRLRRFRPAA